MFCIFQFRIKPYERHVPQQKIISILSNKGGVGKTVFAIELAQSLGSLGFRTLLIDTDINTGDVSIKLKLAYPLTLLDFFQKTVDDLSQLAQKVHSFYLVPGAGGHFEFANLYYQQKMKFIRSFRRIAQEFDFTILDLGAGIERTTLDFALTADLPVIITTPEDIQTGYGCAKAAAVRMRELDRNMRRKQPDYPLREEFSPWFVFNKAADNLARGIFRGVEKAAEVTAARREAQIVPRYLGSLPEEHHVIEKAYFRQHLPVTVAYPRQKFCAQMRLMSRKITGQFLPQSSSENLSPLERVFQLFRSEKESALAQ
ncbi:MAG: hypothetical protein D6762_05590 [Candidatus Neomarinimicrobiota bacterium]|nr:MAG: hypothetical protein D6762_05590 [Candidatus Neomarinimicrobiota bacterium]